MNSHKNPAINYVESTGPLLRVGVLLEDEEQAIAEAESEAGGEHAWADRTGWGWEVVFELGYLL